MTPERWERVKVLYEAARTRSPQERSAFLIRECAADTDLQLEVESLLDQPVGTQGFVKFVGAPVAIASPDANALLYYRQGNKMMMVAVDTRGSELRASAPKMLFEGIYYEGTGASCEMGGPAPANYDVTPDGQRFLMVRDNSAGIFGTRAIVVLNWTEELKARERAPAQAASARAN